MKRFQSIFSLASVISLLCGVIWLSPAYAAPSFTSLGQIKAEGLQVPGEMDLDDAGNLYVTGVSTGKVFQFNQYGVVLQVMELGVSGRGLAVTSDGSRLYVGLEQSVLIVDVATAEVLGELSGAEYPGPEFGQVGEIDLDASGNVFVVDNDSLEVKIYSSDGEYQNRFGGFGATAGTFLRIGALSINAAGQAVVVDANPDNGRVQIFNIDANLNASLATSYLSSAANFGSPAMQTPCGLSFDDGGRAFFIDFMTAQVRVTDSGFGYLGAYVNQGYEQGQLKNVIDATFDPVNDRLFVGCDLGRIEILGVDGGSNPVYVNHAPSVPVPQNPVAGSEVASVSPTLVFAASSDEDGDKLSYEVIVSDESGVVFQGNSADTSIVVGAELVENAAYSWTVQASDGEKLSGIGATANFVVNVVEEAPTVPVLAAPVDGEVVAGDVVLSWSASDDPDPNDSVVAYDIELALDSEFSEGLIAETVAVVDGEDATALGLGDMFAYDELVDGATYFWRVVAIDSETLASEPSEAGQFTYDTTTLSVVANMPDAKVYLGGNHAYSGQMIGVAPLEIRDFVSGTYSVVVERAGFETYVSQITLGDGDNVEVYAELSPAKVVNKLSISRSGINDRSGLGVNGNAAPFLVDFDNDGDLDMLAASETGVVTLFSNMQKTRWNRISFEPGVSLGVSGIVPFVVDWNNDGRKDIVVGQSDGMVKLYLNSGEEAAPAFSSGVDLLAVPVGLDAAPAVADYNGDGAKDLLVGNDAGQVLLFVNQGDDAAPVFADNDMGSQLLKLGGSVVPFPVDWDADGSKELLVTSNGSVVVFDVIDGQYQAITELADKKTSFFAAFPIAFDDFGKQMLAGRVDGKLLYVTGKSDKPVPAFAAALQDKVDELAGLVAEVDESLLGDVAALAAMIEANDYVTAAEVAGVLAGKLPVGDAQTSAAELSGILQ